MDIATLEKLASDYLTVMLIFLTSTQTYYQIAIIILVYVLAYLLDKKIKKHIPLLQKPPAPSAATAIRNLVFQCGKLMYPIFAIFFLRLVIELNPSILGEGIVLDIAIAMAIMLLFHSFIKLAIGNHFIASVFRWVGMPLLFLHLIGLLDDITQVLQAISFELGSIKLSAYGVVRLLLFGSLLFWLGRISSQTGQTMIRRQAALDFRTREVFAKLFEIGVFTVVSLLMLQLLGVNLTALAVFGGAVGVGLGFGLQAIASNFISGIIIIFDHSVSIGDYVELEDGRSGTVTQLNMRSTTLETYDGKDIVVPNEKFITSTFTNWTHKNEKQRYRVDFSVAYDTDVRSMVELVKAAVAEHPQVLSGDDLPIEERPDCEIDSFGDSGINMFVEFWMSGIDDGRNRVGGDLLLIILETLQQNGIEIPFPQRDLNLRNLPPGSITINNAQG